jgi:hypothetical protein
LSAVTVAMYRLPNADPLGAPLLATELRRA